MRCLQREASYAVKRLNFHKLPAVDRLRCAEQPCHLRSSSTKSKETDLVRHIKAKIKLSGPITVAEYMQEVLSNPLVGYYMNKDVFGARGDFITSPEISQMFGELIGIWLYDRWLQYDSPQSLQLVELGPGRGTLTSDILRVFLKLGKISDSLSLHLVEISHAMRNMQKTLLCGLDREEEREKNIKTCGSTLTKTGIPITWHENILSVPRGFSFFLAHEFFDALPIHQFQKTKHGWREIMVDVDEDCGPHHLKYCLAPATTPAAVLIPGDVSGDEIEIRPQAQLIVERMAETINSLGGCALVVDYGDDKCDRHTLRAFKNHQLTSPLAEPGHVDLTANVDFSQLNKAFRQSEVTTFGPVTQRQFLKSMGIDVRKRMLLKNATASQGKSIETAYKMLTDDSEMGMCFKFFTAVHGKTQPPGF